MFKKILILIFICQGFLSFAQTKKSYQYSNGLGFNFNVPIVQPNESNLSSIGGFGLGFNQNLSYENGTKVYSLRSGYNMLSYTSSVLNYKMRSHNFGIGLGYKNHINKLDSLGVVLQIIPNYSIVNGSDLVKSTSGGSNSRIPFKDSISNSFDLAFGIGVELLTQKNGSFEIGYQYQISTDNKIDFIDATPNKFYLRYNLNFSEIEAPKATKYQKEIANELRLFSEQKDTLFILNRSCKEELTDYVLDSLFKKYYKFSSYHIIETNEIAVLQGQNRVKFFALVGNHYSGLSEPESTGIFLLDKNMKLVEYPFPVLTMYGGLTDKCMNDLIKVSESILRFDRRMSTRSVR